MTYQHLDADVTGGAHNVVNRIVGTLIDCSERNPYAFRDGAKGPVVQLRPDDNQSSAPVFQQLVNRLLRGSHARPSTQHDLHPVAGDIRVDGLDDVGVRSVGRREGDANLTAAVLPKHPRALVRTLPELPGGALHPCPGLVARARHVAQHNRYELARHTKVVGYVSHRGFPHAELLLTGPDAPFNLP